MECAGCDVRFLDSVQQDLRLAADLPVEARAIIESHAANNLYLETLSRLSIHPIFSSAVLACYESLFPELVARWPAFATPAQIAAGFGRVLPVVPYLSEMAEFLLLSRLDEAMFLPTALNLSLQHARDEACAVPADVVLENLLALNRLLCFKRDTFLPLADTTTLYHLLEHPHRAVRYLAVRVLCIYLKAADAAQDEMLEKYGVSRRSEAVMGPWEGRHVDYGFLM